MKGTVFSGIACVPRHPDADMHGLLRVIVRAKCWLDVREQLELAGIEVPSGALRAGIWQESKSHAEQQATEGNYGKLLACPLVLQYLTPAHYRPVPKALLRREKA